MKIEEIPRVKTIAPWDGKNAELHVDEVPLDEIMN